LKVLNKLCCQVMVAELLLLWQAAKLLKMRHAIKAGRNHASPQTAVWDQAYYAVQYSQLLTKNASDAYQCYRCCTGLDC
jgi:hypothetical protein